jgi:LysM repeat protein
MNKTQHIPHRFQGAWVLVVGLVCGSSVQAQTFPVTEGQRAKAAEVAQAGVALSELSPNAPDEYTVKSGDTLWAISALFLKSPWRWPELWGMNLKEIANPHLIYPGQQLFLLKSNGRARLSTQPGGAGGAASDQPDLKVSPRNRYESLRNSALPTLEPRLIEPFLADPSIVSEGQLQSAPRIVAAQEGRVLLSVGDRAYARGPADAPITDPGVGPQPTYRVFREAKALLHPGTGAVLGYEAQYLGKVVLARSEKGPVPTESGATSGASGSFGSWFGFGKDNLEPAVPATIDIVDAKEEMRVGDRLLPEPERQVRQYMPSAPLNRVEGRIVSVYGSGVAYAAQNQVVSISLGTAAGMRAGDVLAILKDGARLQDRTDPARQEIKLPNERNGLLMVFQVFEQLSYGLILESTDGTRIGDRVVNPR